MKMPFLISGYEVDSAANKQLFGRLFDLAKNAYLPGEDQPAGLDLITLKRLVGSSYTLCNFASQEAVWEA